MDARPAPHAQPTADQAGMADTRRRWLVAILGTAIAFFLGYVFAVNHPLEENWYQRYLSPALNYACTGHFGPIRLGSPPTAEDLAAMQAVDAFLHVHSPSFFCASFPRHVVPTSVFDGVDSSNVEQPLYLMLSYGVLWRLFGIDWASTHYVVAGLVAASFLVMYLCAWRFMPAPLAAAAILLFLASPFFIRNILSPRDALKFPMAIGIAALLIGYAPLPRRPLRFIGFAAAIGLLIGLGYGLRSDLLLFIFPAAIIIAFLGRLELVGAYASRARKALAGVAIRTAAVAMLLVSFAAAGWLPLLNDYYLHPYNRDMPYHSLAAGLYGITTFDLFQSHDAWTGMYMLRSSYANDLAIGVRVLEHAARRYGDDTVPWAQERYWTYAKRYYLDVTRRIPADLMSGAIGAFVNLMTVPASVQSLVLFDPYHPWTDPYAFAMRTPVGAFLLKGIERVYLWPQYRLIPVMLVPNLLVTFAFLCLMTLRFGQRAVAATVIVLGAVLCVVSLRFELRHVFYIYAFPLIAWASALWLAYQYGPLVVRGAFARLRGAPAEDGRLAELRKCVAPAAKFVALLTVGVFAAAYLVLSVVRSYQADEMGALVADWLKRDRVPLQFDMVEQADGTSLVRVRSAMPISTGGLRGPDDPATDRVQMGVVAVELDGGKCAGRLVSLTGTGVSDPDVDTAFRIRETFKVPLEDGTRYVAFLPAFFYRLGGVVMRFAGVETPTENLPCITGVSAVSEFKRDDVLFDFFVPTDPKKLRKDDLFQRVKIRRIGSF